MNLKQKRFGIKHNAEQDRKLPRHEIHRKSQCLLGHRNCELTPAEIHGSKFIHICVDLSGLTGLKNTKHVKLVG